MSASSAGKQRTNAVKIYWSIDQITIVVCHVPDCGALTDDTTYAIYQKCEPYTMWVPCAGAWSMWDNLRTKIRRSKQFEYQGWSSYRIGD